MIQINAKEILSKNCAIAFDEAIAARSAIVLAETCKQTIEELILDTPLAPNKNYAVFMILAEL